MEWLLYEVCMYTVPWFCSKLKIIVYGNSCRTVPTCLKRKMHCFGWRSNFHWGHDFFIDGKSSISISRLHCKMLFPLFHILSLCNRASTVSWTFVVVTGNQKVYRDYQQSTDIYISIHLDKNRKGAGFLVQRACNLDILSDQPEGFCSCSWTMHSTDTELLIQPQQTSVLLQHTALVTLHFSSKTAQQIPWKLLCPAQLRRPNSPTFNFAAHNPLKFSYGEKCM